MVHNYAHEHLHQRDSHGDSIKMNKPDNKMRFIHNLPEGALKGAAGKQAVAETIYSQVYVTKTLGAGEELKGFSTPAAAAAASQGANNVAQSELAAQQASYLSAKSMAQAPHTPVASSTSVHTPVTVPTQRTREKPASESAHTPVTVPTQRTRTTAIASGSAASSSAVAAAVGGHPLSHTREHDAVGGTPISATHGADSAIGQKSEGMTTGAKAGLAIGILLLIALAGGLLFFCWRRRKQQASHAGAEQLNEKRATKDSFFSGSSAAAARGPQRESMQSEKSFQSTRTAATAPRLSLRPVTQFLPNILGGEKTTTTNNSNTLGVPAMSEKPRSNPFDDSAALNEKTSDPFADGDGAVAAGKKTPGHSQQNSWEGTEPPTPKSAKFGTAAAVAITSTNGPNGAQPARGPNNVHRVQLDFKPSMEDEIDLRSGQLVRMVHEYDDGWALCMRLDRSQQGVCPRTCLSKLPVKPRPQGPPPNGAPGRPMGPPPPNMRRPSSPQINNAMVPRPLTPTGRERSHTLGRNSPAPSSPGPRPRSQSMNGIERPTTPTAVPARKPVPGQAL
ncbi:uncharacterized protein LTR77_005972 [Saxophila tyrrhenica]|uniref:SH3 domain-containing protein n=1 Tax=Saxophila tyrrhenica TaxID=1690608 RepID=A0AAV9P7F8_9PEZI|nr:hypothetical protein LTR77_005972 [Saxophila tyrrhenica]